MWDFSVGQALALMGKTLPFIIFRIVVYAGIALAYVLATGVGAGVGWGVGIFGDGDFQAASTVWGGVAGFGIVAGILYFAREYILYIVKAGHIAVLVKLIDGEAVPDGQGQITYASEVVKARFAQSSVLFAVDQLVKGVLGAIVGIVQGVASLLPIPGLQNLVGLVRAFNPWVSAREALVLYAQNYPTMLRNAAWLTVITYLLAFVVFLVMLAPAGLIVWLLPVGWSAGGFIFALVFAWAVKAALIEPFAIACMMQVFFRVTAGQTPDPEWENRISGVSRKFNELKQRAIQWMGGASASGNEGQRGN